MKDANIFQIVVLGIFISLAVVGVIFFAGFGGFGNSEGEIGVVTVWGTIESEKVQGVLEFLRFENEAVSFDNVRYEQQPASTYFETLVNAIAAGRGPDLFFIRDTDVVRMEDKINILPFDSFSQRQFQETFVEGAELFLHPSGVLALPFSVDPMVLYWNRSLFSSAGVAKPPTKWEEVFPLVNRLTIRDDFGNVTQSTLAFGEFDNVTHAKELIVTLSNQAGSPPVVRDNSGGLVVSLGNTSGGENALEAGLRFFTEFSDPAKAAYSWNSALPASRDSFLAGDLALYPGFASELPQLRQANPNLNFSLTPLPQAASSRRITAGRFVGLAIPNGADNIPGAFRLATLITSADAVATYSENTGLPPVRRDILAENQTDAINSVFYESALIAHTWLDPDPAESNVIFRNAIRDITSGRLRVSAAADIVGRELRSLLR